MGDSANMVLVGFAIGSVMGLVSVVCFLLGRLSRDGIISFPPREASGQPATSAKDAASGTIADTAADATTQAGDAGAATAASGNSPDATDADIPAAPL